MTFQILEYPRDEKLLRRVARPIRDDEFGSDAIMNFAEALASTMSLAQGMGLASTQVAEAPAGEPWRMFAMRLGTPRTRAPEGTPIGAIILCNPMIESTNGVVIGPEGCLSFRSIHELLPAPAELHVKFSMPDGQSVTMKATGIEARCVAHECEHLDGKLLIDKMSSLKKGMFLKRLRSK